MSRRPAARDYDGDGRGVSHDELDICNKQSLRMALAQYHRAVKYLSLNPGIEAHLRTIHRELTVNFPVKMDDGTIRIFTGYRVHHSTARAGRRRAAFATTPVSRSRRCARWPCG